MKKNKQSIVIKIGGSVMNDHHFLTALILPLQHFLNQNWRVVLVHGGGPDINDELKILGIEPRYIDGVRVTDKKSLEVVEKILSGKVNKQLVAHFIKGGLMAIGLSGKDGRLIQAKKYQSKKDYGLVGQVKGINLDIVNLITDKGMLLVLSPLGIGDDFQTYNINSDLVAAEVAITMQADCLVFFTDVAGIIVKGKHARFLSTSQISELISSGDIKKGMIPKSTSISKAVKKGVKAGLIMSKHSVDSLFNYKDDKSFTGTVIYK